MKASILKIAAGSLFAVLSASGQLVITEVMSNSDNPGGSGNGDWFEFYNAGPTDIDLTGYTWDDTSDQSNDPTAFGSITIEAGTFVIVVDENSGNTTEWVDDVWGVRSLVDYNDLIVLSDAAWGPGLSASGDAVYIFDENNDLVTGVTFGDSDGGGKSFAWDTSGNFLGFSTAGTGGAYVAVGDGDSGAPGLDVGSPGFASVPEPEFYGAVVGILAIGFAAVRRRRRA
ncbi:MAG: lamin tail domain-containing protein [Puniceicoccales bacterium]